MWTYPHCVLLVGEWISKTGGEGGKSREMVPHHDCGFCSESASVLRARRRELAIRRAHEEDEESEISCMIDDD